MIGVDQSAVTKIMENFNTKLFHSEYESGLTPEQIATNHNLDEALVWAILLEGKDDRDIYRTYSILRRKSGELICD